LILGNAFIGFEDWATPSLGVCNSSVMLCCGVSSTSIGVSFFGT